MILVWTALVTSHASHNKGKSLKRILGERTLGYAAVHTSVAQQQFVFGTTLKTYKRWTKQMKLDPVVDELGENTHLMWIGPKRVDRVLFFCHGMVLRYSSTQRLTVSIPGGCYFLPVTDFLLTFWRYVQVELKKQNVEIGIALLSYCALLFPLPALARA
jgi:hypothetical protein